MNTFARFIIMLFLALNIALLSSKVTSQILYNPKTETQSQKSLIEKYEAYLVPENIIFQSSDGTTRHYRIDETTVLAIIEASSTDPASASGRLSKSSSNTFTSFLGFLKVQAGATACANYGWRAWAKYPLSSLSCAQSINDVNQNIWCFNVYDDGILNKLEFDTRRVTIDPETASAINLWNSISEGTLYDDEENADGPTGGTCNTATKNSYDFPGDQDIYNAIASPGWFALGYLVCNNDKASYYADFCGATDLNPPSLVISFTPKSVPSTPSLSSPANGATCVSLTVTFNWTDVTNADMYRLQVDDDPAFGSPLNRDVTLSHYTAQSGELSAATAYYWRVRASNCAGNSSYSSYRYFTTSEQTPDAPTLVSPSNGSIECSLPIPLDWYSVAYATSYHLQVDNNSNFPSPEKDITGITSSSYDISSGLQNNNKYYWRIRAINNCGVYGNYSSSRNFIIKPNLGTPPLYSIIDSHNIALPITLKWGSASFAAYYHLEVDNNSDFSSREIVEDFITSTQHTVESGLTLNTSYNWRVRASSLCGDLGSWSSVGIFNFTTDVEKIDNIIPQSYSLKQNYPNPFNPSTQIEFSIPQSSHVSLKVYDVFGKEVTALVDGAKETGTYTTTWNAQNCPSGVYFYRLTAGSYSMTRKLLLLR